MDGLPSDARPVGLIVDRAWNTIDVYLESEAFEEVPGDQTPPELTIAFTEFTGAEGPNRETT